MVRERSARHTNPSRTLGITLAYTRPSIEAHMYQRNHPGSAGSAASPNCLVRSLPSLRSGPGRCSNRITRRPSTHFLTSDPNPPCQGTTPVRSFLAVTVCAPSAITPTAATPITIANLLPVPCFPLVLALISGLLRIVASGLPTSRGSGACWTARSLRQGGTRSVHKRRARRGHGVFARGDRTSDPALGSQKRGAWDVPRRHANSDSPAGTRVRRRECPPVI